LAEDQFGKIQIDRIDEIRNWANKMNKSKIKRCHNRNSSSK